MRSIEVHGRLVVEVKSALAGLQLYINSGQRCDALRVEKRAAEPRNLISLALELE